MLSSIIEGCNSNTFSAAYAYSLIEFAYTLTITGTLIFLKSPNSSFANSTPGDGSPTALIRPAPKSKTVGLLWPSFGFAPIDLVVTAPANSETLFSIESSTPRMPEASTSGFFVFIPQKVTLSIMRLY